MTARIPPQHLAPDSERWPSPLRDLRTPPTELHVLGELPPWRRAVAIVGTRRCDSEAADFARGLAAELGRAGCAIVSGGALGIDAAAHIGALRAQAPTVAVLATGVEAPYPPAHRASLFVELRERGALLSEVDGEVPAHPGRFLARNRIVAGLAKVVVVVQAPRRSGALSTAAEARTLGRPVLVVPSAPWDLRGQGGAALLAQGLARPCPGARAVLEALGDPALGGPAPGGPVRVRPRRALPPGLDDDGALLWRALGSVPRHSDELVAITELPNDRVQRALLGLLLAGAIDERPGARYVRSARR